jgi:hypothetical protein
MASQRVSGEIGRQRFHGIWVGGAGGRLTHHSPIRQKTARNPQPTRFRARPTVCILKARVRVLTEFRTFLSGKRRAKTGALPVATVVCLILLALLAVVQVAHVHPVDTDADHCPLCIAMHTAAPVAVTASVVVLVEVERSAPVYETETVKRPWFAKLFTRPPPDGFLG